LKTPHLDPATASVVLALAAAARVHAPEAPLAWLGGYATRAVGETVERREAPSGERRVRLCLTCAERAILAEAGYAVVEKDVWGLNPLIDGPIDGPIDGAHSVDTVHGGSNGRQYEEHGS
jgi:hypothetical protein